MYNRELFPTKQHLGKQVFRDWFPAVILLIFYATVKSFVNNFREVHIEGIYLLEKQLFGWMTVSGEVPAIAMKSVNIVALTIFTVFTYALHIVVPFSIIIYLGYFKTDREVFQEFRIVFILVSSMAFLTFILFPVAPPWYVDNYGFIQPDNYNGTREAAAGLLKFDEIFGIQFLAQFYTGSPHAPFAAFPSLHSSWSFLCAFILIKAYRKSDRRIYLTAIYPIAVWFSTIYLQHHYILDLIGGLIYSLVAYYVGVYYLIPKMRKKESKVETDIEIKGQIDLEKNGSIKTTIKTSNGNLEKRALEKILTQKEDRT